MLFCGCKSGERMNGGGASQVIPLEALSMQNRSRRNKVPKEVKKN